MAASRRSYRNWFSSPANFVTLLAWILTVLIAYNIGQLNNCSWNKSLRSEPLVAQPKARQIVEYKHADFPFEGRGARQFPVAFHDVAILINVAPSAEQWRRNFENVYSVWGLELPYVYWFTNFTDGIPPKKPHAIRVEAESVATRFMMMVDEALRVVPLSVKWFICVDEDTYLFVENVLAALSDYDPAIPWYLGDISEDLQGLDWYTRMAYGGGGAVMSRPVVEALTGSDVVNLRTCRKKYERVDTGDDKLARCIADLGVPFTRQPGFHQVDIRGDPRLVVQYLYSREPILSYHHVYAHWPLFLHEDSALKGMQRLFASYRIHQARHELFLALHFTHSAARKLTVAINIGWSIRIWAKAVPSKYFTKFVPEYGYAPWQPKLGKGYNFDSEPVDLDFHCTAASFEWRASASVSDSVFTQLYHQTPSHPSCSSTDLPPKLQKVRTVRVVHVPCDFQRVGVEIVSVSEALIVLQVLDCRRAVIDMVAEEFAA
jgi:hypothetical protein